MTKLAIHNGKPIRTRPFPAHITVGEDEKKAICKVIDGRGSIIFNIP